VAAIEVCAWMGPGDDVAGWRIQAVTPHGELVYLVGNMAGGLHYEPLRDAGQKLAKALAVPLR
jgi:hypothetical protein